MLYNYATFHYSVCCICYSSVVYIYNMLLFIVVYTGYKRIIIKICNIDLIIIIMLNRNHKV